MQSQDPSARRGVFTRVLLLYGLYTLVHNIAFAVGYYLLPEGIMRGSPAAATAHLVTTGSFWSEFGLTLLVNLGLTAGLAVFLNLTQVRGMPTGYVIPVSLGIIGGLVLGTNSFTSSDLKLYNAWDGTALGLSIGGLESFAFMLIIAATAGIGIQHYRSWWRWSGEWAPTTIMRWRDIRLAPTEILCLVLGILLLILAAYRETGLALSA